MPAGRYSLNASKTGFIALSYGQRRPLQAGTPLQLAEGQQLKGVELRLPRGGAISGHIFDEDGEPMPAATVRLMRYEYLQGDRRLVPVGTDQTDDRGQYRIWGLNPGEYYVSAIGRNPNPGRGPGAGRMGGGPAAGAVMAEAIAGAEGNVVMFPGPADSQDTPVGYAPTYYLGRHLDCRRPTCHARSQRGSAQRRLWRATRSNGTGRRKGRESQRHGQFRRERDARARWCSGRHAGPMGTSYAARIQWDGAFAIANVPPGRYTLRARGDDGDAPAFGVQPLTVAGDDVAGVNVVLAPGATLSGTVTFEPGQQAVPADLSQVRVTAPAADGSAFGRSPEARVDQDGKFTLEGVPPGPHLVRSNGAPRGWMLKAAVVGGQDVVDGQLEIRSGQKITGVSLVFSDKLSEVGGHVTDDQGVPVTDFTGTRVPDRSGHVASAIAPHHDLAPRSDRPVPDSRAAARRVPTSRRSTRPSRGSGSSRPFSTSSGPGRCG